MARALRDYVILGTRTNVSWLRRVVTQPAFREGLVSTRFVTDHDLTPRPSEAAPAIAAALAAAPRAAARPVAGERQTPSVWDALGAWGR